MLVQDGNTSCEYVLRASLFDSAYKQFFGRTWVGPPQRGSVSGQKIRLNYNQVTTASFVYYTRSCVEVQCYVMRLRQSPAYASRIIVMCTYKKIDKKNKFSKL